MTSREEEKLCSKCDARPATNHICYGGTGQFVDLCDECLRADVSVEARFTALLADEAKSAKCRYCGGIPCVGGTDPFSLITGSAPRNRWMCMSCSAEYYPCTQRALESIPNALSSEEWMARIKEIAAGIDSHMSAFVACRDI